MTAASERPGASLRALFASRKAAFGAAVVVMFALVALVGPWLVSDPMAFVAVPHQPPSFAHWLGTTGQGQDVLAQTVAGARVTLAVGFTVGIVVTLVGALDRHHGGLPGRPRRRRALGAHQRLPRHPGAAAGDRAGGLPAARRP